MSSKKKSIKNIKKKVSINNTKKKAFNDDKKKVSTDDTKNNKKKSVKKKVKMSSKNISNNESITKIDNLVKKVEKLVKKVENQPKQYNEAQPKTFYRQPETVYYKQPETNHVIESVPPREQIKNIIEDEDLLDKFGYDIYNDDDKRRESLGHVVFVYGVSNLLKKLDSESIKTPNLFDKFNIDKKWVRDNFSKKKK